MNDLDMFSVESPCPLFERNLHVFDAMGLIDLGGTVPDSPSYIRWYRVYPAIGRKSGKLCVCAYDHMLGEGMMSDKAAADRLSRIVLGQDMNKNEMEIWFNIYGLNICYGVEGEPFCLNPPMFNCIGCRDCFQKCCDGKWSSVRYKEIAVEAELRRNNND